MDIFIPSRKRHHDVKTLAQLNDVARATIVVYPEERDAYTRAVVGKHEVAICDPPERGIAAKRQWIGENAGPLFVMMDDDITFFHRMDRSHVKLERAGSKSMSQMLEAIVEGLTVGGYDHLGVIDRVAASRAPLMQDAPLIQDAMRIMRVLAFRRDSWRMCEHGRIPLMEDFDVNLQLLRMGHRTGNVSWWAQDQPGTQKPGGCALYRTHEMHEAAARQLAELHPGLVALRQKENKTGGQFGTRTEVTVQWKKAAEEGKVKK